MLIILLINMNTLIMTRISSKSVIFSLFLYTTKPEMMAIIARIMLMRVGGILYDVCFIMF